MKISKSLMVLLFVLSVSSAQASTTFTSDETNMQCMLTSQNSDDSKTGSDDEDTGD